MTLRDPLHQDKQYDPILIPVSSGMKRNDPRDPIHQDMQDDPIMIPVSSGMKRNDPRDPLHQDMHPILIPLGPSPYLKIANDPS